MQKRLFLGYIVPTYRGHISSITEDHSCRNNENSFETTHEANELGKSKPPRREGFRIGMKYDPEKFPFGEFYNQSKLRRKCEGLAVVALVRLVFLLFCFCVREGSRKKYIIVKYS